MRRTRLDGHNKHPWKAEVTEGDPGVSADTITNWYSQVYEPVWAAPTASGTQTAETPTSGDSGAPTES